MCCSHPVCRKAFVTEDQDAACPASGSGAALPSSAQPRPSMDKQSRGDPQQPVLLSTAHPTARSTAGHPISQGHEEQVALGTYQLGIQGPTEGNVWV